MWQKNSHSPQVEVQASVLGEQGEGGAFHFGPRQRDRHQIHTPTRSNLKSGQNTCNDSSQTLDIGQDRRVSPTLPPAPCPRRADGPQHRVGAPGRALRRPWTEGPPGFREAKVAQGCRAEHQREHSCSDPGLQSSPKRSPQVFS